MAITPSSSLQSHTTGVDRLSDHSMNVGLSQAIGILSVRRLGLTKLAVYGPPPSKQTLVAKSLSARIMC
jgi:hypothetical protein